MNSKQHDKKIKARGKSGEEYVCRYLQNKGYNIVYTNYSCRYGEIDIIAENDDVIAFVEVKTRKQGSFVSGIESITPTKLKKIILTAVDYITKHNTDKQPRIDCVQVTVSDKDGVTKDIIYIENAVDNLEDHLMFS